MSDPGTATGRQAMPGSEDAQGIAYREFCEIMGSFASGIGVVTTLDGSARPHGFTCSAVCSVSADPPLILSCVRTPSSTLDAIRERNWFAVNFLDAHARDISDLFASRSRDKFADVQWRPGETAGLPVLDRTLAHAECTVHSLVTAGDHVIILGRVIGGAVNASRFPLCYWRGGYVRLFRMSPLRRV